MIKRLFTFILLTLAPLCTFAQGVSVEAKIDSMAIYIGEQTGVTLTVIAPQDKVVQMPAFKARDMVCPGVEVVEVLKDELMASHVVKIDGVGLKATRATIGMPTETPPKMPPQWLVRRQTLSRLPSSVSSPPRSHTRNTGTRARP